MGALGASCGSEAPSESPETLLATSGNGIDQAPVIRDLRLEPVEPSVDDTLRAVPHVLDAEGDEVQVSYQWTIDGETIDEVGPELDLSRASPGSSVRVSAVADDGNSRSAEVDASTRVIDRPPVMNGIAIEPTHQVYPGDEVLVTPTATDPDGGLVDFRFEWFVNDEPVSQTGRSFSSERLKQGDRIRVRVVAWDDGGDSRPLESEDVVVGGAHPEILSSPPGITDEGMFRYVLDARDPDGDALRYRLSAGPDGMRIDEVRGVIEWRPRAGQTGVHPVAVVVRDTSGFETTQRFEVTVNQAPPAAASEETP